MHVSLLRSGLPSLIPVGEQRSSAVKPTASPGSRGYRRARTCQAPVCQARPRAAAAAAATEPRTDARRKLPASADPAQRNGKDASTSSAPNGSIGSTTGNPTGAQSSTARSTPSAQQTPPKGDALGSQNSGPGATPRAAHRRDSLRAGVGLAGVPVDGARRTVRMPRGLQPPAQQLQRRGAAASGRCPRCGGRGVLQTARGPVPCPDCQASASLQHAQQAQQAQQPAGLERKDLSGSADFSDIDWDAMDEAADAELREERKLVEEMRDKKVKTPMSAEKRAKISAAMRGKRQHSDEHRAKIARSMQRLMKDDSFRKKISDSTIGRPKTCSVCGKPGHNRARCPDITGKPLPEKSAPTRKGTPVGEKTCGNCGQRGHTKRTCPHPVGTVTAAQKTLVTEGPQTHTCSHCGGRGHDRRSCPELNPKAAARRRTRLASVQRKVQQPTAGVSKVTCSYCGQHGHNRRTCPQVQEDRRRLEQQLGLASGQLPANIPPELLPADPRRPERTTQPKQWASTEESTAAPSAMPASPAADARQAGVGSEAHMASPTGPQQAAQSDAKSAASVAANAAAEPSKQQRKRPASQQATDAQTSQVQQQGVAKAATAPPQQAPAKQPAHAQVPQPPPAQRSSPPRQVSLPAPSSAQRRPAQKEEAWEKPVFAVPVTVDEEVAQAADAVLRAWRAGVRRQRVELMLPLSNEVTADGDQAWPGGIRQQFRAAQPLVEALLRILKQEPSLQGRLSAKWLDEADCVGAWESDAMAAVLFPSAETLNALRHLDADAGGQRLVLVINPQWQLDGQVVPDFGFGRSRREAEEFVRWFEDTYYLKRLVLYGDDVRVLHAHDGHWQVHTIQPGGKPRLVSKEAQPPTLTDLGYLIQGIDKRQAPPGLFQRVFGSLAEPGSGDAGAAGSYGADSSRRTRRQRGVFAEPGPGDFTYSGEEPPVAGRSTKPPSTRRSALVSRSPGAETLNPGAAAARHSSSDRRRFDIITGEYAEPQPGDFGYDLPELEPEDERHAKWRATHSSILGHNHGQGTENRGDSLSSASSEQLELQSAETRQSLAPARQQQPLNPDGDATSPAAPWQATPTAAQTRVSKEGVLLTGASQGPGTALHAAASSAQTQQHGAKQHAAPAPHSQAAAAQLPRSLSTASAAHERGLRDSLSNDDELAQRIADESSSDASDDGGSSDGWFDSLDGDSTGRFGEIRNRPRPRDVRMEPVRHFKKWAKFFGSSDEK